MTNYFEGSKLKYRERTDDKDRIRERDNHTCQICGGFGDQVDHIIPWRVSHDNSDSNRRVLCLKCNLATRRQRYDANPFTTIESWYRYLEEEKRKCERMTAGLT